jgi:glycolate oxidase iron-sulfur subunit
LFATAVLLGRIFRSLLPREIGARIPRGKVGVWPLSRHKRKMIALRGCVQPALAPMIDAATARVLDRVGISLIRVSGGGCCGAMSYHLSDEEAALAAVRRNIDAWWPHVKRGVEAIVVSASGCGVMIKEYGHLLRLDPAYAAKAKRISEIAVDPVEVVAAEWSKIAGRVALDMGSMRVAFQSPCSLQHGLRLGGRVEEILLAIGFELTPVPDAHLCCGSAGTYSIFQPAIAGDLRAAKLAALESDAPQTIATANIGCLVHLASGTTLPVRHWIELLDARMVGGARARD